MGDYKRAINGQWKARSGYAWRCVRENSVQPVALPAFRDGELSYGNRTWTDPGPGITPIYVRCQVGQIWGHFGPKCQGPDGQTGRFGSCWSGPGSVKRFASRCRLGHVRTRLIQVGRMEIFFDYLPSESPLSLWFKSGPCQITSE